jgi:DinB superfamily
MPDTLAPTESWRQHIGARIGAMNGMLNAAVKDLSLEQVNHRERPGVLSIAFSLAHVIGGQDRTVARYMDNGPTLWESGAWRERVGYAGELPQRGTPMKVAEAIQFANIDAWREYQAGVFARTDSAIANTPLERFNEVAMERPADTGGSFLFAFIPSGPIRLMDLVEAYLFQHAARHLGEIEHARALVGLGGIS